MDQALRSFVLQRDGGCVARFVRSKLWATRWPMLQGLPDPGPCKNQFGTRVDPYSLMGLEVDHVKGALRMAKRAEDDPWHVWTMCPWHHRESHWATMVEVRDAAREYIASANAFALKEGWPVWPADAPRTPPDPERIGAS